LGEVGIELTVKDQGSLANSMMSLTCSDDGNVQPVLRIV
jgi:hypothetical protein